MTTNPDFTQIPYKSDHPAHSLADWQAALERETGRPAGEFLWRTMEGIDVRPLYTAEDMAGIGHLDYVAGLPPYSSMWRRR